MPCVTHFPEDEEAEFKSEISRLKAQVNEVTALLCYLCGRCEADGIEIDEPVRSWWTAHKEADRQRAEAAAKKAESARLANEQQAYLEGVRTRLLTQLTPEELEALGVKNRTKLE